jgi:hypothetical protein
MIDLWTQTKTINCAGVSLFGRKRHQQKQKDKTMNKDNAKDYLPLVQALADGKTIQIRGEDHKWKDMMDVAFLYSVDHYRIAEPKPVVDWPSMPAWVNAVARDADGRWHGHVCKPDIGFYGWSRGSAIVLIPKSHAPKFSGDWMDSLVERP